MPFRRIWTEEEDKILKYLKQDLNIQRWSLIAQKLEHQFGIFGRNQKQCRQRYHNHLDSTLNLGKLSEYEEKQLLNLHNQLGNKWAEIATYFQGRTDASLKNIFHSKLRKAIRKINRFAKDKYNGAIKPYPLNFVCKIMEKADPKPFNQSNQIIQTSEYIRELQNGLIEFSGSAVHQRTFEGWNEKKIFQHLIKMLDKTLEFQHQDLVCEIDSMSEESEYVPLKQKKSSSEGKHKFKIDSKQDKKFSETFKQNFSSQIADRNSLEETDLELEVKELPNLQKNKSFETLFAQSQHLQNKHKNYSFETNIAEADSIQMDESIRKALKEINDDWQMNKFEKIRDSSIIQDWSVVDSKSLVSDELFQKIIEEGKIDPACF